MLNPQRGTTVKALGVLNTFFFFLFFFFKKLTHIQVLIRKKNADRILGAMKVL